MVTDDTQLTEETIKYSVRLSSRNCTGRVAQGWDYKFCICINDYTFAHSNSENGRRVSINL